MCVDEGGLGICSLRRDEGRSELGWLFGQRVGAWSRRVCKKMDGNVSLPSATKQRGSDIRPRLVYFPVSCWPFPSQCPSFLSRQRVLVLSRPRKRLRVSCHDFECLNQDPPPILLERKRHLPNTHKFCDTTTRFFGCHSLTILVDSVRHGRARKLVGSLCCGNVHFSFGITWLFALLLFPLPFPSKDAFNNNHYCVDDQA